MQLNARQRLDVDINSQRAVIAFCTSVTHPIGKHFRFSRTDDLVSKNRCTAATKRVQVSAAHPPRRVGNVAKDLREALQNSLKARTSRIEVRLPFGAKLGTEKRKDDETVAAQRTSGDREVARLISGMFEGTGLSVCVAFPTDGELNAANKMWGPLSTCATVSWATGSTANKKKKQKLTGNTTAGFGKQQGQRPQAKDSAEFDVLIAVGGGAAFMDKIRKFSNSVGMDKLVIIANTNGSEDVLPVDLDCYFEETFEPVYIYTPNPSPKWSGGVLFRKFPDGKCAT